VVIALLGIVASGVRGVVRAEASASKQLAAAAETFSMRETALKNDFALRETAIRKELSDIPISMAKSVIFERELLIFAEAITALSNQVTRFDTESEKWLGNETLTLTSLVDAPPHPAIIFQAIISGSVSIVSSPVI
jgi:hypothetical protein